MQSVIYAFFLGISTFIIVWVIFVVKIAANTQQCTKNMASAVLTVTVSPIQLSMSEKGYRLLAEARELLSNWGGRGEGR